MKKIFCFVLALVLCLSAVVTAGATELPETDDYSLQVKELICGSSEATELFIYEEYYRHYSSEDEVVPDYVFVLAGGLSPLPSGVYERFGDYYFLQDTRLAPIKLPLQTELNYLVYVPAENALYTIPEACEMGFEDLDKAFASLGGYCALVGDAHRDFELNIKDATAIQKHVAGMEIPWKCSIIKSDVFDYNNDEDVDVKDATAIQKHLAGIVE